MERSRRRKYSLRERTSKAIRRPGVAIENQAAVAQHAVDQIGVRAVEDHEIDRHPESLPEIVRQIETETGQGRRRRPVEEDGDVDVAAGAAVPRATLPKR